MGSNVITIQPYTVKELASLYAVSTNTMRKWIMKHKEEVGTKNGHYYMVGQVTIIFNRLGYPVPED